MIYQIGTEFLEPPPAMRPHIDALQDRALSSHTGGTLRLWLAYPWASLGHCSNFKGRFKG